MTLRFFNDSNSYMIKVEPKEGLNYDVNTISSPQLVFGFMMMKTYNHLRMKMTEVLLYYLS